MPFRSVVTPATLRLQRAFHSSMIRTTCNTNHYDTLQVPITASPSDIKKSFYRLSKTHHPDRNRNDPDASKRFVKISEAYATLGHAEKRHMYDRDVIRTSQGSSHSSLTPRGSYYSSGPAGGRPASGLSRRRTQFRGPPPSFYRSGGWGTQSTKRQAAQDEASYAAYMSGDRHKQGGVGGGVGGGMGPRKNPFAHDSDVPHFDREAHFRTHSNHERRRRRRMSEEHTPTEPGSSTFANFIFVGAIISLTIFIPSYLFETNRKTQNQKEN